MKRVPPSSKSKAAIEELLQGGAEDVGDPRSTLLRLALQYLVAEALKGKTRDLRGRAYDPRGEAGGYRNGYRPGRLKTAEGEVPYHPPQVRGSDAGALTALRELLAGRTEGLEALAVALFARGCSTRDVEAAFSAAHGRPLLSTSAVAKLSERLWGASTRPWPPAISLRSAGCTCLSTASPSGSRRASSARHPLRGTASRRTSRPASRNCSSP